MRSANYERGMGWRERALKAEARIKALEEYYNAVEAFDETPRKDPIDKMFDRVNSARAALKAKPE